MLDILLCEDGDYVGDLDLTEDGDIQLGDSLLQNIKVAISWILDEWRLGPDIGLPWYEDILVKNPNTETIRQEIISAILDVEGVTDADVEGVTDADVEIEEYVPETRRIKFNFTAYTDDESYSGEVILGG